MIIPDNIEELLKLAKAADYEDHSATAFELFQRVIALDPSKDSAIYRAVKNLLEIGRISDAELLLNQIKRNAAPRPWLIESVLGQLRLAQFRPTEAEKHFRNAWKLRSDSTAPAIFLAAYLKRLEKFDEAIDVLTTALKTEGDLDGVYLNLGLVNRAKGDYKSARLYLLKALEITPIYPDVTRVLADVEHWLKLNEKDGNQ